MRKRDKNAGIFYEMGGNWKKIKQRKLLIEFAIILLVIYK